MGLEEPSSTLTRRRALQGLGGLGAAALWVTGCAAKDPVAPVLTTVTKRPSGTLLWSVRAPTGIISLVAADGLVCAGIDNTSSNILGAYAVHAGTGHKAWTQYGAAATPFAAGTGVLFGVSPYGVTALSTASGKVRWTSAAGTVNLGSASTWVLVTDGTVCTTSQISGTNQYPRNVVLGIDSRNGRRKWAADFPSTPMGLACSGGTVFAGSPVSPWKGHGKIAALSAATGKRRWTSPDLHMVPGDIVTTAGTVTVTTNLLSSSPGSERTFGLEGATGRQLWRADEAASPLAAGGGLVFGVTRTLLWARDARSGRQVWERAYRQQTPSALAVTGDTVLAATGYNVQALSAATGSERWSHALPVFPIAITTADDVVYVAGTSDPAADGGRADVYAFQV